MLRCCSQWTLMLLAVGLFLAACSDQKTPSAEVVTEVVGEAPTRGGIPWFSGSVDEAFAAAKTGGKPIFLYWGAAWCPPCHELKATIFQQEAFIEQSRLFVPVYLDGDTARAQKYGEQFGVMGYPTVVIFSPEGLEITRIPGGMNIEQYLGVLELALNALRPVRELLADVQSGGAIGDADWQLLANYAWGQDRGQALGEQELHGVLQQLASACPRRLVRDKTRLQMQALVVWLGDDERDESLAPQYRQQLNAVLASDESSRQNINLFLYSSADLINELAGEGERELLQQQLISLMLATVNNPELNVLTRIDALYGWLDASAALLAEDQSLPPEQLSWLVEQVEAARGELNSYQLHTAINTIWQLYYEAGLEIEARAALQQGLEVSDQPYYFMSGMGYLDREAGNNTEALAWYRRAWDAAQGPATRVQWGSNYLLALLKLSPDDLDRIAATGAAIMAELAAQTEGLAHRNTSGLNRVSRNMLTWMQPADGATSTEQQRRAVASGLRSEMDKLCTGAGEATDALATCESFLVPADDQAG